MSKAILFWACAGSVVLAIIVGFSWGGWMTTSSAQEMAEEAAATARQEVAAAVCVDRFMAEPDAVTQLTALQEIVNGRARGRVVEDGGWAALTGSSRDDRGAANLCADSLAELDIPAERADAAPEDEAPQVQ
ncbi:MAG: hypothetical protein AAF637_22325 [Pseudomonadota bacterium]